MGSLLVLAAPLALFVVAADLVGREVAASLEKPFFSLQIVRQPQLLIPEIMMILPP